MPRETDVAFPALADEAQEHSLYGTHPYFRVDLHVLAWNITERQHEDITRCRENIYDLVSYLRVRNIPRIALAGQSLCRPVGHA